MIYDPEYDLEYYISTSMGIKMSISMILKRSCLSVCIICSLLQYLGVLETIERFGMATLEVTCMFQNGEDVIKFCIGIL